MKILSVKVSTCQRSVFHLERIYMISMGSMVTGGELLQSHLLSTTTIKRLLLGICCMTKDLQPKQGVELKCYIMNSSRLNCLIWLDIFSKGGPYLNILSWPKALPDTALTVNVACRFFDRAFRDKGRVFCITRHHHGFTPRSLS